MKSSPDAAINRSQTKTARALGALRLDAGDCGLDAAALKNTEAGSNLVEFFRILSAWSAGTREEIVE